MSLPNYEIVCRVGGALTDMETATASNPIDRTWYLERFARTVNEIMGQRDDTDVTDARCGNCGAGLFQPRTD